MTHFVYLLCSQKFLYILGNNKYYYLRKRLRNQYIFLSTLLLFNNQRYALCNTTHFMSTMVEEDEYACVNRAHLKLKDNSGIKKKKKKAKKEAQKAIESEVKEQIKQNKVNVQTKTKAELAFQKMQEKMQKQRILQKAEMTHKQRVEKFNQHLDSLTEHFDIPKVSWTK